MTSHFSSLNKSSPLIKRIKRHITGPVNTFFIATLPGLENICKKELESLGLDINSIKLQEGGIEFSGKLKDCCYANLYLRTANRILMRITEFNVTNFRKLEKKCRDIPWELYLKKNTVQEVAVTARHSRLYHSDAISERVIKSLKEREKTTYFHSDDSVTSSRNTQNIFIRLIDDHMTISIDSSGDLLYKRGIKQHTGNAPMRETLAAAALLKAGYHADRPLFDPMCGTGTFSIEAAMIARNIPPGLYRQFAFESWPGFKQEQWSYMKKQAEAGIKNNYNNQCIVACDTDKKICKTLSDTLEKHKLGSSIRVLNRDFFSFLPGDIYKITGNNKPGLVIINPPYGIRLGTKKDSRVLFIKIISRLTYSFSGWKFALFSPEKSLIEKCSLEGEYETIDHGGLKLTLFTGTVPEKMKNAHQ